MADVWWVVGALYVGGFLVAARTLPWVMDRRLHALDTTNPKALFLRTVQMLVLALVWPVTVLLLQLTNGVLAARNFTGAIEPPAAAAPPRRRERPSPVHDSTLLSGPHNAPSEERKRERTPLVPVQPGERTVTTPMPERWQRKGEPGEHGSPEPQSDAPDPSVPAT